MPGIAAVDALEVPRARDDFREVSALTRPSATLSHLMGEGTRARPRLQQEERFHIDLRAAVARQSVVRRTESTAAH
jgi:hypothetical protein